jgi:hypothetical protein
MAKLSDADVARINQQLAADPQWAQLVQAANAEQQQATSGAIPYGDYIAGKTPAQQAILQYYASHNIPLGPNSGNNAVVQPDGTLKLNHPYKQFAKTAALSAGAAAGGALAVGAFAPAAGAGAVGAGGAGTAGTVAGTAAAAGGGSSLLHDLLPTIIGAGATLGGTAISAKANSDAAKIAAEQADKALALQKEQYALQRQDTAPYRALGQGAVGNLGFLSGIDTQSAVPELSSTVPKVPYGQQAPSAAGPQQNAQNLADRTAGIAQGIGLSQLGQPSQSGGLVPVKNPATGLVHLIPQSDVQAAQQAGGQMVGG